MLHQLGSFLPARKRIKIGIRLPLQIEHGIILITWMFSRLFYDETTVRLCGATDVVLRPDQIRHFHRFTRKMVNDRSVIECDLVRMLFLREHVIEGGQVSARHKLYIDKMWRAAERRRGYSPLGDQIFFPVCRGDRKNAAAHVGALSIEETQVATPVDTNIDRNNGKCFCDILLCKIA
jgi:hypothetical protein